MSYEHVRDWRKNTKLRLVQGFGGRCGHCGVVDHPVIYDFHHLDGSEKEFGIATQIRAWSNILSEAEKCVMLCAPCHRKVHAGVIELSPDVQRFDEGFIERKTFYDECPVCSNQKPKSQITCSVDCARRHRHKIDWDTLDLLALFAKYKNASALSRVLGTSDVTVRKHLRRRGII